MFAAQTRVIFFQLYLTNASMSDSNKSWLSKIELSFKGFVYDLQHWNELPQKDAMSKLNYITLRQQRGPHMLSAIMAGALVAVVVIMLMKMSSSSSTTSPAAGGRVPLMFV